MMGILPIGFGYDLEEALFDGTGCVAWRNAKAVAQAKNVGIDGNGGLAKNRVEDHICRFSSHAR
jgi:hypothetical protein